MKYTDLIYGDVEIIDDVIIDIINTSDFQRLRGVEQSGYSQIYFPNTMHTRFEHSVGCYLLLRKFNASREEQIAGLIHDMSHTAFSHTADYVFDSGRGADHNYQDDIFENFVRQTEVFDILNNYGFDVDYILDESNFPLQENNLPNLCADRIDYSLRGAVVFDIIKTSEANNILKHLQIIDDSWVFDEYKSARRYAEIFKKLNDIHYSNKEAAAMYLRTSNWIKYAADKGYITYEELFATDNAVIEKINANIATDRILEKLWKIMNNPKIILGKNGDKDVSKIIVKSRIVDPLFIKDDNVSNISDCSVEWNNIVKKDLQPKVYYVKE